MTKTRKIVVQGNEISVMLQERDNDYICITDMIRSKEGDFFVTDWLRNRNTLEYIGAWEQLHNPNFNYGEFAIIKSKAGLNNFKISVKELCNRTNAIGIFAKAGRYGGTYAHKDIAFNFGMWISPIFQLYIVQEYQRLREKESNPLLEKWNVKRLLAKTNYSIHTNAIKSLIPKYNISKYKERLIYASEADMLNIILFGCTAEDWRTANPELAKKGLNLRDTATINQLVVLSNIESMNSELLKQELQRETRMQILHKMTKEQLKVLKDTNTEEDFRMLEQNAILKNDKEENK